MTENFAKRFIEKRVKLIEHYEKKEAFPFIDKLFISEMTEFLQFHSSIKSFCLKSV